MFEAEKLSFLLFKIKEVVLYKRGIIMKKTVYCKKEFQ